MAHPEALIVSANVINNPLMGWMHYHMGALHPYLPESAESALKQKENGNRWSPSWRQSTLPSFNGDDSETWRLDQEPPYEHHRWLPLRNQPKGMAMARTPISNIEYHPFGSAVCRYLFLRQMTGLRVVNRFQPVVEKVFFLLPFF